VAFARGAECFSSPNNNALCQRFFVQINEQKRVSVCRSRGTREFVGAVLVGGREEGGFKKRMMTKEKGGCSTRSGRSFPRELPHTKRGYQVLTNKGADGVLPPSLTLFVSLCVPVALGVVAGALSCCFSGTVLGPFS
jgi:hypothetical protein